MTTTAALVDLEEVTRLYDIAAPHFECSPDEIQGVLREITPLILEVSRLRADLARVTAERDAMQSKVCKQCGLLKPETEFPFHHRGQPGRSRTCKACDAINNKAYRETHQAERLAATRAWRQRNPERLKATRAKYRATPEQKQYAAEYMKRRHAQVPGQQKAHWTVKEAVEQGRLVKQVACELCGATGRRIDAHHDDYSKPLDVLWLCKPCHSVRHGRRG